MRAYFLAVAMGALVVSAEAAAQPQPVVGAIRWDAWTAGSEWEKNLGPRQWRSRLPFYGREVGPDQVEIHADTQEVMDQEIAYASAAGLDYWAYCFSLPTDLSKEPDEYALKLHLASKHKTDMHFSLLLMGPGYWGPGDQYPRAADTFAKYFRDPAYQKGEDGRPLLFIFYTEMLTKYFGSEAAAKAGLDTIRSRAVAAGLKPPLIVAQVWSATQGADCVNKLGFDAVSAYTMVDWSKGEGESPYSVLAASNKAYWEACAAADLQVVPIVVAGWDNRPRWRDPKRFRELYQADPKGPWYVPPTPKELAGNLRAAFDWIGANPSRAEPRAILIYAWNESDEGGWLVPTLSEGTARLDAIMEVLGGHAPR
jgi:hypothetical protein